MKPLTAVDAMCLEAAKGWLELGNHLEANEELEKITASLRAHPDVLELRWRVYARASNWEMCLAIAETLVDVVPRRATSWAVLATSLKRLGRVEEAYEALIESLMNSLIVRRWRCSWRAWRAR